MRKYSGPKKLNKLKASGKSIALAIVGIIIIAIFAIGTWHTKFLEKNGKGITLAYSEYYEPKSPESNADVFKMINALNKINTLECPSDRLSRSAGLLTCSNSGSSAGGVYFITNANYVNTSDSVEGKEWFESYKDASAEDAETWRNSNEAGVSFYSLFPEVTTGEYSFAPIVAPFQFRFTSKNTDGTEIAIESIPTGADDVVYSIKFVNALAWFCAGDTSTRITYADLEAHTQHGTIVGASKQSSVQSGYAGAIIGFADMNTTVQCSKKQTVDGNRVWEDISLAELYGY